MRSYRPDPRKIATTILDDTTPGVLPRSAGASRLTRWIAVVVVLTMTGPAWGGLYNPCEPDEGPFVPEWMHPKYLASFRTVLFKYRLYGKDPSQDKNRETMDNPTRQRYGIMRQVTEIDSLTPTQKLALSEYWIRQGDAYRALRNVLVSLSQQEPDNFLVLSNMATASQLTADSKKDDVDKIREYDMAIFFLKKALDNWPRTWEGLSVNQKKMLLDMAWTYEGPSSTFQRCRSAEEYYLKLLQSRQLEIMKNRGKRRPLEVAIDPLFTDSEGVAVRYVGPDGQFTPGKLAEAERARLPQQNVDEAVKIVQQLLVWLPTDVRLYWQLGELYNARGTPQDLRAAREIFDDLKKNFKVDIPAIAEHRSLLNSFAIPAEKADIKGPGDDDDGNIKPLPVATAGPVSWSTILVTFGFGAIVAIFLQWQINELRRRRQHRSP